MVEKAFGKVSLETDSGTTIFALETDCGPIMFVLETDGVTIIFAFMFAWIMLE